VIGFVLMAVGGLLLYGAFTQRGDAILAALNINLPAQATQNQSGLGGSSSGSSAGGSSSSSSSTDSGTHQAMDAQGNVYTINSAYGDMTDAQKGDANRYANTVGNFASSTS